MKAHTCIDLMITPMPCQLLDKVNHFCGMSSLLSMSISLRFTCKMFWNCSSQTSDRMHKQVQKLHYDEYRWCFGNCQLSWRVRWIITKSKFNICINKPCFLLTRKATVCITVSLAYPTCLVIAPEICFLLASSASGNSAKCLCWGQGQERRKHQLLLIWI